MCACKERDYRDMYSRQSSPMPLKRSHSRGSQSTYASATTTVSHTSSKLLFGETALTPATTVDGSSIYSDDFICNFALPTSSASSRFWLNASCRNNVLDKTDRKDLSNLRLVCHVFSSEAAPLLFEKMNVTFRTSTFTKPARLQALSRIGCYVKHFTFRMPYAVDMQLPPIIDPCTGTEKRFVYEPQVLSPQYGPCEDRPPKYGSWEMQDLLVKQYPPLFHAATNVPTFCAAFSELINLTYLKISCPESTGSLRYQRGIVDYALISLRLAIERAPLHSLSALSLDPIHPRSLLYFRAIHGLGSTPSSAKRWGQIRRLSICIEGVSFAFSSSVDDLRILRGYLATISRSLTRLFFRWEGERGPSPLSLDRELCRLSNQKNIKYPSLGDRTHGLRTWEFPCLRVMELENAHMDSVQINDFFTKHKRSNRELILEGVKIREEDWNAALGPSRTITGSDRWRQYQEEVADVPIMLSSVHAEPTVMRPLLGDVDGATERGSFEEGRKHVLSKRPGQLRKRGRFWSESKRTLHRAR